MMTMVRDHMQMTRELQTTVEQLQQEVITLKERTLATPQDTAVCTGFVSEIKAQSKLWDKQPFFGDLKIKEVSWLRLPEQRGEECSICYNKFKYRRSLLQVQDCGHLYCNNCMNEHLKSRGDDAKCPLCNQALIKN